MNEIKPGWKTTEFYLHLLCGIAISALTAVQTAAPAAGLPPLALAGLQFACPFALAWLAKSYAAGRTAEKIAAQGSTPAPTADALVNG
jgi:hypothetical protein